MKKGQGRCGLHFQAVEIAAEIVRDSKVRRGVMTVLLTVGIVVEILARLAGSPTRQQDGKGAQQGQKDYD